MREKSPSPEAQSAFLKEYAVPGTVPSFTGPGSICQIPGMDRVTAGRSASRAISPNLRTGEKKEGRVGTPFTGCRDSAAFSGASRCRTPVCFYQTGCRSGRPRLQSAFFSNTSGTAGRPFIGFRESGRVCCVHVFLLPLSLPSILCYNATRFTMQSVI